MDWKTVSSLLWLLAWAALFFFMMSKGGCGMHGRRHHEHGAGPSPAHDRDDDRGSTPSGTSRDPVCGMQIDPDRAAGFRQVAGQAFYLCSATCLERFDSDPTRYMQGATPRAEVWPRLLSTGSLRGSCSRRFTTSFS